MPNLTNATDVADVPTAPDGVVQDEALTDAERGELDTQIEAAKSAYDAVRQNALVLAAVLLVILRGRLFREHGSFVAFVEATDEFEFGGDYAYKYARWGRLNEVLVAADEDPIEVESHARQITPLLAMSPDSDHVTDEAADRAVQAVRAARFAASEEGVRPAGRHFKDARERIDGAQHEEAIAEAIRFLEATAPPAEAATVEGLSVVSADGHTVPWDDGLEWETDPTTPVRLSPTRIDPAAGRTYPVLLPAGKAATTWEPTDGPFQATCLTARFGTPIAADAGDAPRDRVVLVAPGVDLLHNDIDDRVILEVAASVGSDPTRLYLVWTSEVARAGDFDWSTNVSLVVEAQTADDLVALSSQARAAVEAGSEASWTVVLRDLVAPPDGDLEGLLDVFSWVLVRGKSTTWRTLGALFRAVPSDKLHVSREVTAKPQANPLVPTLEAPERTDRPAAVEGVRRRAGAATLPPTL
ncbi:hypothetical protein [Rubrivirga sp.]|uniref:hypothetical protein n=1 Tax=Rubrivirga sp. TaxID=1885344 RepID=UPI003C70644D